MNRGKALCCYSFEEEISFLTLMLFIFQSWDPALARIAKAWAKSCRFAHNPQLKSRLHPNFTVVGENIWTGSLFLFSASAAISDWYNEIKYYDFSTMRCTKVCGHYTQVNTPPGITFLKVKRELNVVLKKYIVS